MAIAGLFAMVTILASCFAETPAPTTVRVDTLEGGTIQVRNPSVGAWDEGERWRLVDRLSIGSLEGETDAFEKIADVAVDDRGFVWVADERAGRIRVYGPDGSWIRTVGRDGWGPGEFGRPDALAFDPRGRLWIADWRNIRYTLLDSAGEYLESYPRHVRSGSDGRLTITGPSGRVIDRTSVPAPWRDRFFVPGVVSGTLPEGTTAPVFSDTLVLPWVGFRTFRSPRGSGAVSLSPTVPFTPRARWAIDPTSGQVWVGTSDSYVLTRLDMDSVPQVTVFRAAEPIRVARTELDSIVADLEEAWPGIRIDAAKIPSVKPFFRWMSVSDDGSLWVGLEDESGRDHELIDVFYPAGVLLGTVRVPGRVTDRDRVRFVPVVRRDGLYGVVTDDLDVQFLVRYRIERPRDARGGS